MPRPPQHGRRRRQPITAAAVMVRARELPVIHESVVRTVGTPADDLPGSNAMHRRPARKYCLPADADLLQSLVDPRHRPSCSPPGRRTRTPASPRYRSWGCPTAASSAGLRHLLALFAIVVAHHLDLTPFLRCLAHRRRPAETSVCLVKRAAAALKRPWRRPNCCMVGRVEQSPVRGPKLVGMLLANRNVTRTDQVRATLKGLAAVGVKSRSMLYNVQPHRNARDRNRCAYRPDRPTS